MNTATSNQSLPRIIAILRGLQPQHAVGVCDALLNAGITAVEVPLNRPGALASISKIANHFGMALQLGAGTVLDLDGLQTAFEAGARFMFSPHFDTELVSGCLELGCLPVPGVATPSEGFAAVKAGASVLKLFPGDLLKPKVVRAWRAVFPDEISFISVGGVDGDAVVPYLQAGAHGVALGSWLYKPGIESKDMAQRARELVARVEEFETC